MLFQEMLHELLWYVFFSHPNSLRILTHKFCMLLSDLLHEPFCHVFSHPNSLRILTHKFCMLFSDFLHELSCHVLSIFQFYQIRFSQASHAKGHILPCCFNISLIHEYLLTITTYMIGEKKLKTKRFYFLMEAALPILTYLYLPFMCKRFPDAKKWSFVK